MNNKSKILERQKIYQQEHPEVRKKSQEKTKSQGGYKVKGKREREKLANSYIAALIREEGSNKSLIEKKVEVMKYRVKKLLKEASTQ